jgi:hypothetical protein
MLDTNRKTQELLADYAGALRDGSIPVFLKSLGREEARTIASSRDFSDATEVVRVLNAVGFADKAATPDVGLFISRVDAKIVSRLKEAKSSSRGRRGAHRRSASRTGKTEKPI